MEKIISVKTNTAATITASSTTNREAKQTISYNIKSTDKKIVSYVRTIHYADKDEVVTGKITPSYNYTEKMDYNTSYKSSFYVVLEDGSRSKDYNFQYFWVHFSVKNKNASSKEALSSLLWPMNHKISLPELESSNSKEMFNGWVIDEKVPVGGKEWSKITKNTRFYDCWREKYDYVPVSKTVFPKVYAEKTRPKSTLEIFIDDNYGHAETKGMFIGTNENYWENEYVTNSEYEDYGSRGKAILHYTASKKGKHFIVPVNILNCVDIKYEFQVYKVTVNYDKGKDYFLTYSLPDGYLDEPVKKDSLFAYWMLVEGNKKTRFDLKNEPDLTKDITVEPVFIKDSYEFEDFAFWFKNFGCEKQAKGKGGHCDQFAELSIALAYNCGFSPSCFTNNGKKCSKATELVENSKIEASMVKDSKVVKKVYTLKEYICRYRHGKDEHIHSFLFPGCASAKGHNAENLNSILNHFMDSNNKTYPLKICIGWNEVDSAMSHAMVGYKCYIKDNEAHLCIADSNHYGKEKTVVNGKIEEAEKPEETEVIFTVKKDGNKYKATGEWSYNYDWSYANSNFENSYISAEFVSPVECNKEYIDKVVLGEQR